jgi:ABC-type glutathione transport system ATPase component
MQPSPKVLHCRPPLSVFACSRTALRCCAVRPRCARQSSKPRSTRARPDVATIDGMSEAVLCLQQLSVAYRRGKASEMPVLRNLDLTLGREIVGIQGVSGSGKTTLARTLLRLLDPHDASIRGRILLGNDDLASMPPRQLRKVRGGRISLIPQEPSTALSPVRTVESQICEVIRAHLPCSRAAARQQTSAWLETMFAGDARRIGASYPHQISGGQRQRVVFIQGLCASPSVVIADEPTSNLDSIAKRDMLELLREAHERWGAAVLLISHDREAVAFLCDRVLELRDGRLQ